VTKEPFRFVLIGAGAIARTYVDAIARMPHVKLVGVMDIRPEAAASLAQIAGCAAFADLDALTDIVPPDGAIVCTPPATHVAWSLDLLERGIHVLCEKPLAPGMIEAEKLLEAAATAPAKLTMASKFRCTPDIIKARELILAGTIGKPILFENIFTSRVDMTQRWNSDPAISGGGVLIDNGTHSVDIMRYLIGPLDEIQAVEGLRVQPIAVEDTVRVFARSKSGVMGTVDLSWSIHKELPHFVSIYGSEGTICVGWKESKFRRQSDKEWTVIGKGYDKIEAFQNVMDNFVQGVRGEAEFTVSLEDAFASVEVIDTAYQALRGESWRAVPKRISSAARKRVAVGS
jgi:predicted dehydrogenase